MKKRCLILLAAILLFAALFSAAAFAEEGDPDRFVLTAVKIADVPVSLSKPYETWFMEKKDSNNGSVYAVIVQQGQQSGISTSRFSYTVKTVEGKKVYTMSGGPYNGKQLTVDGSKATMNVPHGSSEWQYIYDVYTTRALFAAEINKSEQVGSYIDYAFDAKNGRGALTFRYDIYNAKGDLVESGSTTDKSLPYKPASNDIYTLYLTAMDQDLEISEYAYATIVYSDSDDFEIENGIIKRYKGTGTSVTVPTEFHGPVTGIAANAFSYASNLEKIMLPDTSEQNPIELDIRAFSNCSAKLYCSAGSEMAKNLSFNLRHPFYDHSDAAGEFALQYMKINGYVDAYGNLRELLVLNKYTGTKTDVTIPEYVDNIYVDYIYNNAFEGSTVKNLVIPDGVLGIGTNAFKGCRQLNSVQVGTGLTSIGANAFYDCVSLNRLDLTNSNNIKEIGANAFYNCPADAQIYCNPYVGITWWTVSNLPHNFFYEIREGESVKTTLELRYDSTKGLTLYRCFGTDAGTELEIPYIVEYIAPNAFKDNKGLIGVTALPPDDPKHENELKEIGDNAFEGCTNLTNADLKEAKKLTTIGNYTFNGCNKLGNVKLPASLNSIGNYAFAGCKAPADLSDLENLTVIGASAFYNCKMDELKLPNNVTSIGGNAFADGLKIVIHSEDKEEEEKKPRNTTTAHAVSAMPHTFFEEGKDTLGLRWVVVNGVEKLALFEYDDSADPVNATVPNYVNAVDKDAFSDLKSTLRSVIFDSPIDEIPTGTFDGYDKLESIELVAKTGLAAGAIQNCSELSAVYGLDDLSVFDTNFDNCPKLLLDLPYDSLHLALDVDFAKAAKLPFTGSHTVVEYSNGKVAQFDDKSQVVTAHEVGTTTITLYADGKLGRVNVVVIPKLSDGLTLPANLTAIWEEAFEGGSEQYVVLPKNTKVVGRRAFADNKSLRFIVIPKGAVLDSEALAGSTFVVAVLDGSDDITNINYCKINKIPYQFRVK